MASEEKWDIGFFIAELSLVAMALSAVCVGSYTSVKYIKSLKEKGEPPKFPPLSTKEALKLPFQSAGYLVLLYLRAKLNEISEEESKLDEITKIRNSAVEWVIVMSLATCNSELIRPLISFLVSPILRDIPYQLSFKRRKGEEEEYLIDTHFTTHDIINFLSCIILGLWYILTKNWIINNIIAIVGAILSIKHFHVNKMMTGCILLTLFIIYDVFFVFGTHIMDTVATSLDVPVKLMFPRDIMKKGLNENRFIVFGLGDITLPGAMIAFLLRFDLSLQRNSWIYFSTSITSYCFGLLITSVVFHFTQRSQPALLYLVPCSVIPPLVLAFFRGDVAKLFKFEDHPEFVEQNEGNKNEDEQTAGSSHSLSSSKEISDKNKDE